ncbi:Calx-beta domain-containing protein [Nitrincola alkalilacustris]|uniref:Calx-beta domain-containing protein n=1 Tax=Nitrincola alkalilacustris TaxID=1571224 RepID=UPI00124D5C7B|nr:Calx-beta domain-containing protein [Nitrincola alkalilacustris]
MVATVEHYTNPRYQTQPGEGFDGVVRVSNGSFYGTGTLLFDGRAILTAAHIFRDDAPSSITVHFDTIAGKQSRSANHLLLHPEYDAANGNHDLALVWLTNPAPKEAQRHEIYRDDDEIGQVFNFSGYGIPGTGNNGEDSGYSGPLLRLQAFNRFDADASALKVKFGSGMGWTPFPGSQLIADFDNGQLAQDALGRLLNINDTGLGLDEGMITRGDSGGPAFINNQVAGIASYISSLSTSTVRPDIDNILNSSFGEVGFWQRASFYQQWVDQSLREKYPDAPTSPDEVETSILEGDSGDITYTYFLLQFTGMREHPQQWLSVDYSTRDGTATAGEDYVAVSGTLILYPGENQAVIVVEILGDDIPEPDETFYLDIFNPVGGSFGDGVEMLSAMRTIIDDDGFFL